MKYYLGIDGGGTKTRISIIDEYENLIFENTGGPSSIDTVTNEETFNTIQGLIEPFVNDHPEVIFSGIFAGIGGIVFDEDCELTENIIKKLPEVGSITFLRARNDMENALYSSGNFDSGIALICGTGMVAFGKNNNQTHKCGGWGYREGEIGSAYNLGREAIRYAIRAYDHRLEMDEFAKEIGEAINMKTSFNIMKVMDVYYDQRTMTAKLAPIVTYHASLGNTYARKIVDKATYELALAVKGVYKHLSFNEAKVVLIGSLGNAPGYFNNRLIEQIKEIDSNISIIQAVYEPSHAAALAAKKFSEEI